MNKANPRSEGRRSASVRALEVCHVFSLCFEDYNNSIEKFPEYKNLLDVSFAVIVVMTTTYAIKTDAAARESLK